MLTVKQRWSRRGIVEFKQNNATLSRVSNERWSHATVQVGDGQGHTSRFGVRAVLRGALQECNVQQTVTGASPVFSPPVCGPL